MRKRDIGIIGLCHGSVRYSPCGRHIKPLKQVIAFWMRVSIALQAKLSLVHHYEEPVLKTQGFLLKKFSS